MRKAASKLHWQGRSVLAVLALAAAVLGLLVLNSSSAKAEPPPFNCEASTDVPDTEHLANSNIESTFSVGDDPWPSAMYDAQISFTPSEWGVAAGADVPIGAIVGKLNPRATLGWFNSPCAAAYGGSLDFWFDPLMNCSIDTSDTIPFTDSFGDTNGNNIPDGCDKYPEMLETMFPGMQPVARHAGFEFIGISVSLSFLTFEPGTSIPTTAAPGVPPFSSDLGYVAMSVLNDPTAPLVKNQITDMCPPLGTDTTYYGLTLDNPNTPEDESGYAWRTNPRYGGTYTFNGYTHSIRDADGDDIDNEMDTCPHIANEGDPRVLGSGDNDKDGIDNACDPTPNGKDLDPDGDGFPNRQDNCPLVANEDQTDTDFDGIGDACDQPDWNGDTVPDPGAEAFSPTTPDGEAAVCWFTTDIEISGPAPPVPGQDTDGDGFEDVEEVNLGSDPEDADSMPEHTNVAGSCTDGEDNDLDGYVDDVDGGCGDDTDGDGASDDGEDDLGSDPEDANSTPEDVSVAGTCTDGEDNDLDGDTDAADEGCAEEEVTPTPTPTPTPTVEADATPTPTVEAEYCSPVFPGTYNGLVRIDGQPAASGYEVTASIDGEQWGSAIVSGGRYAMDIPGQLPTVPPCFEGGTITFALDEMECTPTADWASGIHNVDLSCAPAAPPVTPTPAVTPTPVVTPTPTVTPVVPPPTGAGGLSGSSSGLPLWGMALASWAGLMTVAGLGTLVAAKRR